MQEVALRFRAEGSKRGSGQSQAGVLQQTAAGAATGNHLQKSGGQQSSAARAQADIECRALQLTCIAQRLVAKGAGPPHGGAEGKALQRGGKKTGGHKRLVSCSLQLVCIQAS